MPTIGTVRRLPITGLVALVWSAVSVLTGCDVTSIEEIESEDVIVAEAYLQTGTPFQEAFLHRTLQGDSTRLRVDGATVEVRRRSDGASLGLMPGPGTCADYTAFGDGEAGSCYRSAAVPGFVRTGETYELRVLTADGRQLEGRTTVPGPFEVRRPAADTCTLGRPSVELLWTASEGAWSYQVVADFSNLADGLRELGVVDPPDALELVGLAIGRADTTIVFPREFGVFDRFTLDRDVALALQQGLPAGARADIVVAAGDRNFVNWVRGGNFNPSGQVRVPSVAGDGTGVFASLVTARQTILSSTSGYPACQ